ncbi:MAG: hypothetical protein CL870_03990 [Cytophagia bacterium]|nr:hypothetical protein [Cytophagia bacterium]|tara:strand:- start:494 stop:943 length:450 start_codon:yes stop_codon:yes gene_type:complete
MCLFRTKEYSGMYENLGYNNDKTLIMLKDQFNLSRKLYYNYLLNLMPKYWHNIYMKLCIKFKENNNNVLYINNIFQKMKLNDKYIYSNDIKNKHKINNNKLSIIINKYNKLKDNNKLKRNNKLVKNIRRLFIKLSPYIIAKAKAKVNKK